MKTKSLKSYDIAVIGGGMAGLTLSLCLAKNGKKVVCIDREAPEKQQKKSFDGRTVAISLGSSEILDMAGIWAPLLPEACPINKIEIMDGGGPSLLNFLSEDVDNQSFGWIIENRLVRQALFKAAAKQENLDHLAPEGVETFSVEEDYVSVSLSSGENLQCQLLVGADGRNSWVREQVHIRTRGWSYNQRAVICTAQHENPHNNIAIEDFRPEGPFAVLPMADGPNGEYRSSVVWTEHGPKRRSALNYSEEEFNTALNARFPGFYGDVKQITPAQAYPLGLTHAERYTSERIALVADAAHGIHPIAGQGLNIGLRDVKKLVELTEVSDDPGSPELLKEYERARRLDNMGMVFATDSLNKLFSNNIPPVRIARRLGLKAVAKLPFAKQFFMKQAMGLRN